MKKTQLTLGVLLLFTLTFIPHSMAKGVYQTPLAFLDTAFNGNVPTPSTIWINKVHKQVIADILQHSPSFIRVKYWQQDARTAWILEEIGKEKPITVGVILDGNKISTLKVLTFRETRGWEVKHSFFTRQFNDAQLTDDRQLNKTVDGISGATLSVRALKKIARIALYLQQETNNE